jgi:hypothetical protein
MGAMRFKIGRLDVECGGMRVKRFGLWIPDGLHVWWGNRGVHLFWASSPYMPRVTFEPPNLRGRVAELESALVAASEALDAAGCQVAASEAHQAVIKTAV